MNQNEIYNSVLSLWIRRWEEGAEIGDERYALV